MYDKKSLKHLVHTYIKNTTLPLIKSVKWGIKNKREDWNKNINGGWFIVSFCREEKKSKTKREQGRGSKPTTNFFIPYARATTPPCVTVLQEV